MLPDFAVLIQLAHWIIIMSGYLHYHTILDPSFKTSFWQGLTQIVALTWT